MEDNIEIKLGNFELSLNVTDLRRSLDFYNKLGFDAIDGTVEENYLILTNGKIRIGLYQGHIPTNFLTFRGGDVKACERVLKSQGLLFDQEALLEEDGSTGAIISDPDGNTIYFNAYPGEKIED